MTVRSRWRLAGVLLVIGAVVGIGAYLALRGVEVEVVQPHRGTVEETVVSSGQVLAPAEINLGALVMTTVREVYVDEGARVTAGQLLVQLDDSEALAALQQAEAALEQAQAGRYELTKLSEPAARSNLTKADAALTEAKRKLQESEQLFESSYGTKADYDDAKTAYTIARAQREAAQLQLEATGKRGSQSVTTSAGIAVAKAKVELAKAQLAHTRIESPVDGVILTRYIEPGDAVMAGSKLLLLSRTGATRLVIEPDERNLARLQIGQPALASAEAFPDQWFAAQLQYIAPSVDPQRGTIEVQLGVADPPAHLRPHMTVSVEITVGEHDDTLLVPRQAVRGLASDAPFVLVVDGARVRARPVRVGIRGDDQVELLDGLESDAWIVADGSANLVDGDRVRTNATTED